MHSFQFLKPRITLFVLAMLSLVGACVSVDAVDRAVNDPSRIAITPPSGVTFDPGKTYAVIELASRSERTGKRIYCDMQGTRTYSLRRTFLAGECQGGRSFVAGTFDGSPLFSAVRTQVANGALLAVYEIETPMEGQFAAVATSVNANLPLRIFADLRPVHQFSRGAINLLARRPDSEAGLRQAFLQAFPGTGQRLSGQILRTFQPACNRDRSAPTCGVGADSGVKGPVIVRQSRDGSRTVLNAETAPASSTPSAPTTAPAIPGSPPLFEGTPYASFTPEQIAAYCAQDWSERTGPNGRTEYNPCKRRDAFP